jgi:hypothetical protein
MLPRFRCALPQSHAQNFSATHYQPEPDQYPQAPTIYMAAYEVYAQQLSKLKHGLPLWEPEPIWQDGEVRIGDVGYVRRGRFARLFNTCDDLGSLSNHINGVPRHHTPLPLSTPEIHRNPHYHEVGPLYTASVEPPMEAGSIRNGMRVTSLESPTDIGSSIYESVSLIAFRMEGIS